MSTTTRKNLFTEKYLKLSKQIEDALSINILPSLTEYDVVDIIFFINMHFAGTTYRDGVKTLIETHKIKVSDTVFETTFPFIEEFLVWLKNLT